LTATAAADTVTTMPTTVQVDVLISTLNATEVGTLDSVAEKLQQVERELRALNEPDLATRAQETLEALLRGDVVEFKRGRAFLLSKIGHLRR
jgi:hypothetical protein